jgi:hypothetical protein
VGAEALLDCLTCHCYPTGAMARMAPSVGRSGNGELFVV